MEADRIRNISQIRCNPDLDSFRPEAEADRIGGIVRDRETVDRDIADRKTRARLKEFQMRRAFFPIDLRRCKSGDVNRNFIFARQTAQTGDVIRMLVRHKHRIEPLGLLVDQRKTPRQLAQTQPRIDQKARLARCHQGRVAGTTARQYAKLNDNLLPSNRSVRRTITGKFVSDKRDLS